MSCPVFSPILIILWLSVPELWITELVNIFIRLVALASVCFPLEITCPAARLRLVPDEGGATITSSELFHGGSIPLICVAGGKHHKMSEFRRTHTTS